MESLGCVPWTHEYTARGRSARRQGTCVLQPHRIVSDVVLVNIQQHMSAELLQGKNHPIPSRCAKYYRALGNKSCVCLNRIAIIKMKRN